MAEVSLEKKLTEEIVTETDSRVVLDDKERKIVAVVFISLAIIAVLGGFFLWRKNLSFGFLNNQKQFTQFLKDDNSNNANQNLATNQTAAGVSADPNKDTDYDGLSDWQEVNVYHTSPYVADTDSDSILDGQEVKAGTDPNCSEGQKCTVASPVISSSTASAPELLGQSQDIWNQLIQNSGQNSSPLASTSPTDLQLGNLSAKELRNVLKNAGAKDEDLNKLSDTQLQAAWQAFLADQKQ